SKIGSVSSLNVALPELNKMILAKSFSFFITASVISGHPLLATVPAISGHASSLSRTPSASVSSHGHPLFSISPASSGQLSSLSRFPSDSVSSHGHPLFSISPASSGQLSSLSNTLSPSES